MLLLLLLCRDRRWCWRWGRGDSCTPPNTVAQSSTESTRCRTRCRSLLIPFSLRCEVERKLKDPFDAPDVF